MFDENYSPCQYPPHYYCQNVLEREMEETSRHVSPLLCPSSNIITPLVKLLLSEMALVLTVGSHDDLRDGWAVRGGVNSIRAPVGATPFHNPSPPPTGGGLLSKTVKRKRKKKEKKNPLQPLHPSPPSTPSPPPHWQRAMIPECYYKFQCCLATGW